MKKRLTIVAIVLGGLVAIAGIGLWLGYLATQQVPAPYIEALELDNTTLVNASDRMLQQASALASDVRRDGPWEAVFTAEQINGWLAVDLVENHPGALPSELRDPRVAIAPDRIQLFCRLQRSDFDTVLTLAVEPYVPEPNVLALRIRHARAGSLPMPLGNVLDQIAEAGNRMGLRVEWLQADGDPVAQIVIPPAGEDESHVIQIETLQLHDGEIYLSGTTRRVQPK